MQLLSFTVICFLTVYVNGDVLVPSDPQRRAVNGKEFAYILYIIFCMLYKYSSISVWLV